MEIKSPKIHNLKSNHNQLTFTNSNRYIYMRIIIADDHQVVREGLKRILIEYNSSYTIDMVSDGKELLEKIERRKYSFVILDIAMPGKNGLEVLKDIKKINSSLPVLILSMYPEEQYAIRAIKSGASGYLTKDSASEELLTAINNILKGHKYITSSLAEKLANKISVENIEFPHKELTDREFEVFKKMAAGNTISFLVGL